MGSSPLGTRGVVLEGSCPCGESSRWEFSSGELSRGGCSYVHRDTSVASFLVLGGGGEQDPQMYRQKK